MSVEGYPIVDYLSTNAECEKLRRLCYNLHFDYPLSEREYVYIGIWCELSQSNSILLLYPTHRPDLLGP